MTKNYERALKAQKKKNVQTRLEIYGTLGAPIDGHKLVNVPDRPSFVYVRLRDNQNELIEAFNNKVASSYNLPVILRREGGRYIVLGVNTQRYGNNWNNYAAYLPKHGTTHSFGPGGGGDVSWIFSRQFMPTLLYPSNSYSGTNVTVGQHSLLTNNGIWKQIGGTGTVDLLQYVPTGSDSSVMVLVYLDTLTGNPGIIVNSGSYPSNLLTGSDAVYPYIPVPPSPTTQIALGAVRVSSGTYKVGWDNIYDLRQWLQPVGTGTNGVSSVFIQDEGINIGTADTLNFVGSPVSVTIGGSVARVFVTGTGGNSTGSLTGIPIYNQGVPIVTGTTIDFTGNVYISNSGSRAVVNFPITTYFRVGQPNYLSSPTGLYWQVPDRVYASGSLGVFVGGHALIPGIDYIEDVYTSGLYQYLSAQPTGSYHLVHYGVPCYPQTYALPVDMSFWLTDSDGELLVDSDGIQLTDSDG